MPASPSLGELTRSRSTRWLAWLLGAALVAAVIAGALHFAEAKELTEIAEHAEPWWLALAVVFQLGTYLAQGQVYRCVTGAARYPLRVATAYRLSLVKLFVDQALPSGGLSGTVVLDRALERRGMPRAVVAAAIVVDLASYYHVYALGLLAAIAIATLLDGASATMMALALVFVAFAITVSVGLLALSGRDKVEGPRRLRRFRIVRTIVGFLEAAEPRLARDRRVLVRASLYQLAIVLCDAATMFVLVRALGARGSVAGVFASFMISSLLRTLGPTPGGLGAFEAASVVTLRVLGVPLVSALAATLMFRALSFWLPMLPGLVLSRREVAGAR